MTSIERRCGADSLRGPTAALGGHKDHGLSLLAQVLGATLNGGAFAPLHNRDHGASDPANVGHSFIAIDPPWPRAPAWHRCNPSTPSVRNDT